MRGEGRRVVRVADSEGELWRAWTPRAEAGWRSMTSEVSL